MDNAQRTQLGSWVHYPKKILDSDKAIKTEVVTVCEDSIKETWICSLMSQLGNSFSAPMTHIGLLNYIKSDDIETLGLCKSNSKFGGSQAA